MNSDQRLFIDLYLLLSELLKTYVLALLYKMARGQFIDDKTLYLYYFVYGGAYKFSSDKKYQNKKSAEYEWRFLNLYSNPIQHSLLQHYSDLSSIFLHISCKFVSREEGIPAPRPHLFKFTRFVSSKYQPFQTNIVCQFQY